MNPSPSQVIVLYSKYSPKCREILHLTSISSPVFKFLCIDNQHVRKSVIESSLDVKTVPCVLLRYPDNQVEKFESDNITQWIQEQLSPPQLQQTTIQFEDGDVNEKVNTNVDVNVNVNEGRKKQKGKKSAIDIAREMESEREKMAEK